MTVTISNQLQESLTAYARRKVAGKTQGIDITVDPKVKCINPNAAPDDVRYDVSWTSDSNQRLSVECIIAHPSGLMFMDMGIFLVGGGHTRTQLG